MIMERIFSSYLWPIKSDLEFTQVDKFPWSKHLWIRHLMLSLGAFILGQSPKQSPNLLLFWNDCQYLWQRLNTFNILRMGWTRALLVGILRRCLSNQLKSSLSWKLPVFRLWCSRAFLLPHFHFPHIFVSALSCKYFRHIKLQIIYRIN